MSLGFDTLAQLPFLRAQAESRFTETFTFTRTQMVKDQNGIEVETDVVVHEGIRGRVKFTSQVVSDREHGAQLVTVQQRRVDIGVDAAPGLRVGDKCTVTASDVDASLVGAKFRLAGMPDSGQVTAQRWPTTEAS